MTMRLTPNKIVGGTIIAVLAFSAQNRFQSRHTQKKVDELKALDEEERMKLINRRSSSSKSS